MKVFNSLLIIEITDCGSDITDCGSDITDCGSTVATYESVVFIMRGG